MLSFYQVDYEYLEYLRKYEPKVPFAYGRKGKRPFLGIVLKIHHKNYFAPLSSPKQKHKTMKDEKDFIKIKEGELGVINLNNMIPIPISKCIKMDFCEITDEKYKMLLVNQMNWCKKHKLKIEGKALFLYQQVYEQEQDKTLLQRCCNFPLLEEKCHEYMKESKIQETEFEYKYA